MGEQSVQEGESADFPETCGAHIDDPCDCFNPQAERRYRLDAPEAPDG